jgi:hypothetical protein
VHFLCFFAFFLTILRGGRAFYSSSINGGEWFLKIGELVKMGRFSLSGVFSFSDLVFIFFGLAEFRSSAGGSEVVVIEGVSKWTLG